MQAFSLQDVLKAKQEACFPIPEWYDTIRKNVLRRSAFTKILAGISICAGDILLWRI